MVDTVHNNSSKCLRLSHDWKDDEGSNTSFKYEHHKVDIAGMATCPFTDTCTLKELTASLHVKYIICGLDMDHKQYLSIQKISEFPFTLSNRVYSWCSLVLHYGIAAKGINLVIKGCLIILYSTHIHLQTYTYTICMYICRHYIDIDIYFLLIFIELHNQDLDITVILHKTFVYKFGILQVFQTPFT